MRWKPCCAAASAAGLACLPARGQRWVAHVVESVAHVADRIVEDGRDFGRYNGVFKEYFPEGNVSRTTVEARAVISCKIEMDAVAYKPKA